MEQYCCNILCPNFATHKITYSLELDLGEMGFTFSCTNHLKELKLSDKDSLDEIEGKK